MSDYFQEILNHSKRASSAMSKLSAEDRSRILMNISGFLLSNKNEILKANQADVERAKSAQIQQEILRIGKWVECKEAIAWVRILRNQREKHSYFTYVKFIKFLWICCNKFV